jgi:hypothetical protein
MGNATGLMMILVATFDAGLGVASAVMMSGSSQEKRCGETQMGEESEPDGGISSKSIEKSKQEVADYWTEEREQQATGPEQPDPSDQRMVDEDCYELPTGSPEQAPGEPGREMGKEG